MGLEKPKILRVPNFNDVKRQIMMKLKNLYILGFSVLLFSNCFTNKLEQKHLLARLTATEDRLEIQNLLAGSAFSSDVASEAYWTKMFTHDAVFDRGQGRQDKGRTRNTKNCWGA